MSKPKPDYGLDAPGVFRGLLIGGLAAAIAGFLLARWALGGHSVSLIGLGFAIQNTGIGCLIGAAMMFASSRYGKLRVRDRLLRGLNLRGDEAVLDVGCGHGLLLIGAAKRLPQGRAVGIDLWSQVDQGTIPARPRCETRKSRRLPIASKFMTVTCASSRSPTPPLTPRSRSLRFTTSRATTGAGKRFEKSRAFSNPAVKPPCRT